jgi:hypothetical protein
VAEQKATPTESSIENPMEWLDKRLDAKESPASETPAEPTVAEPAAVPQPVSDWKDVVLPDDVDHGFFRGKKVGDLYQSYRHVETAKQKAESERNELKQRLDKLEREREAEAAVYRVQQAQAPRQSQPGEDPRWAEVDNNWFTDNVKARKIQAELIAEQAAQIADQRFQQYRQEAEQVEYKRNVLRQGEEAYDTARTKLNLDTKTWNLRAPAVMLQLTDQNSPYYGDGFNVFRPEAYLQVYRDIYGEAVQSAPPVVVKPTPELPPPPGSKRPTPVSQPDNTISPLTRERADAVERFAMIGGVDPKRLAERTAKRLGGNRG